MPLPADTMVERTLRVQSVRIQRKRSAGYNMQAASREANGLDCISVTRPGDGNPYDIKIFGRELSLTLFRNSVEGVWSPYPVKDKSNDLCAAAFEVHRLFMRNVERDTLRQRRNLSCAAQGIWK